LRRRRLFWKLEDEFLKTRDTYTADFAALAGATGPRTITLSAMDTTGNYATATETVNVVEPNPVPSLTSLSPSGATHGGAAFTLTVNGSNFASSVYAQWKGAKPRYHFREQRTGHSLDLGERYCQR
jgi:fermentation-respiration switch protein FrsA (DUF1100 family)